jgi:hypothetical protein
MATFNIVVEIPNELADNFDDLHKFQKHIMYQVQHYNTHAAIEATFNEEICVSKFEETKGDV